VGRNKQIRKKIEGHRKMIDEHRTKIECERQAPNPREYLIAYWRKRIRDVELKISRLEEQLRRY
jgi:hypothetical protein